MEDRNRLILLIILTLSFSAAGIGQGLRGAAPTALQLVREGRVEPVEHPYESSHALVIGMSDYKHFDKLKGPLTDVQEVKTVLEEHDFKVEMEMDLDSKTLLSRMDKFLKDYGLDGKRRIVIYFAGHGWTLRAPDGRDAGYIVPVDAPDPRANEKEFKRLAVDFKSIISLAERVHTRHSLFIFDSCFSGSLTMRSGGGVPAHINQRVINPARQFITSGSADQQVPDVSRFRRYFVEGMRGAADLSKDAYITADELFNYLERTVTDESKGKQTPRKGRIEGRDLAFGDMVFFLKKPSPIDADEAGLFEAAKVENTSYAYRLFLNTPRSAKFQKEAVDLLAEALKKEFGAESNKASSPDERVTATVYRGAPLVRIPFEFDALVQTTPGAKAQQVKLRKDSAEIDVGGTKITLVAIEGGKFKMGDSTRDGEGPVRSINVQPFFIGVHEITKKQWAAVAALEKVNKELRRDPATQLMDEEFPVVNVSWSDAREFCNRLERLTGLSVTLPSEAQWEYAARGGTETLFAFGPQLKDDQANFKADSIADTHIRGQFRNKLTRRGAFHLANAFGLYDMHGNAAEWVLDSWAEDYRSARSDDSAYVTAGDKKVVRGGSYKLSSGRVCSSCRMPFQDLADQAVGFRIVLRAPVIGN